METTHHLACLICADAFLPGDRRSLRAGLTGRPCGVSSRLRARPPCAFNGCSPEASIHHRQPSRAAYGRFVLFANSIRPCAHVSSAVRNFQQDVNTSARVYSLLSIVQAVAEPRLLYLNDMKLASGVTDAWNDLLGSNFIVNAV